MALLNYSGVNALISSCPLQAQNIQNMVITDIIFIPVFIFFRKNNIL